MQEVTIQEIQTVVGGKNANGCLTIGCLIPQGQIANTARSAWGKHC